MVFIDVPPEITFLSVQQLQANDWSLSGIIFDEAPAGLTITFGGIVPAGLSAVVLADGSFECIFTWNAPSTGMATATVDDVWGQTSDLVEELVFV